ncbi:MAG: GNAT family N-acetyltransferase [Saprospiraceae bacterium]|nr:GNAT family N-acetyltransferase [Saprospiraceae bacterium]
MTKSTIHIRTARPTDADAIVSVHIDSWRTTYRGIIPDEYLDNMNVQARANFWRKELTAQDNPVFVAEQEGAIVGFATAGQSRDDNHFDSELYAIYVLQPHQRKNIGSLLLAAISEYLQTCGHRSMYVWVLADNSSKHFYERLGGVLFDKKVIEISGRPLTELAYGWSALSDLITST